MPKANGKPMVAFTGASHVGKTTLICQLTGILSQRGIRVGAVKHTDHDFLIDREGKDTFSMRHAGADPVLICSTRQLALMRHHQQEPSLEQLVEEFFADVNLVLAEGFHLSPAPKVIVHRLGVPKMLPASDTLAVVSDDPDYERISAGRPIFRPDQAQQLADLLTARLLS